MDMPYMVASGEWMLDHGRLLSENVFSAIPFESFSCQNWLGCVGMALVSRLGAIVGIGDWMLVVVHGLEVFAGAFLARRFARRFVGPGPVLDVSSGVFVVAILWTHCQVRVWSQVLFMLVMAFLLTDDVRRGAGVARLLALPVMCLVCTNVQGSMGLLYAVCCAWLVAFDTSREHLGLTVVTCVLCILAGCANPYFSELMRSSASLASGPIRPDEMRSVMEATLETGIPLFLCLGSCVGLLACGVKGRPVAWHLVVMGLVSCVASMLFMRFLEFCIPIVFCVSARCWPEVVRRDDVKVRFAGEFLCVMACMCVACFAICLPGVFGNVRVMARGLSGGPGYDEFRLRSAMYTYEIGQEALDAAGLSGPDCVVMTDDFCGSLLSRSGCRVTLSTNNENFAGRVVGGCEDYFMDLATSTPYGGDSNGSAVIENVRLDAVMLTSSKDSVLRWFEDELGWSRAYEIGDGLGVVMLLNPSPELTIAEQMHGR